MTTPKPKKKPRKKSLTAKKSNQNVSSRYGVTNRKQWWPNKKELDSIYEDISTGMYVQDLIEKIGVSSGTFYRKIISTDPRMLNADGKNILRVVIDEARKTSCEPLLSIMYKKAQDNNDNDQMRALIWWLEQIGPYKDNRQKIGVQVINQQPLIDINPQQISEVLKLLRPGNVYEHDPDA